jgi:hypothetical protein
MDVVILEKPSSKFFCDLLFAKSFKGPYGVMP